MRPLLLALAVAAAGCTIVEQPYVHRASPRVAASTSLNRRTTVETCDGQTLVGFVQSVRTDSLDLGRGRRIAWSNVRTMTAPVGRKTGAATGLLLSGAVITGLATASSSDACDDCLVSAGFGTAVLGGTATLIVSGIVWALSPKIHRTYGFACPVPPPPGE